MLLSMWTLLDFFKKNGLCPIADISSGSGCIRYIRLNDSDAAAEEEDDSYAVLSSCVSQGQSNAGTSVSCGIDRIFLENISITAVHDCIIKCFDFYNEWEHKLMYALIKRRSLQDILEIGREVFLRPMFIKSAGSMIYAITNELNEDVHANWKRFIEISQTGVADMDSVMGVSTDTDFRKIFTKTYPVLVISPVYGGIILHSNIFFEGKCIAEIVVLENNLPFNNGDPHLLHFFQKIVAEHMKLNPDAYSFSSSSTSCFIDLIEGKPYIYSNFNHVRQRLKWQENDDLAIVCITDDEMCITPILNVLTEQLSKTFLSSCFSIYGNIVFGIINVTKNQNYNEVLLSLNSHIEKKPFKGAISYEFNEISETAHYYNQCVNILKIFTPKMKEKLVSAYEISIPYLASELQKLPNVFCYDHPDLRRLRKFDLDNNSEYLITLFNF